MLKLESIAWKPQDGEEILKGINLTVAEGRLTVITGPNGGGKTSLAKIIAGLQTPTAGKIWLDGQEITDLDITQRSRMGIGYAFQQPVRFKGLTVRSLLEIAAGGDLCNGEICQLLGQVGLCTQDYIDREVNASLSGGEIKRIEIATVLAKKNARLLIFDEPEAGIDLWSFTGLIDAFEQLKAGRNCSLLIISHQERILEIADEIVVIADGKVRTQGSREEVLPALLENEKPGRCPLHKEVACNE